MDWGAILDKIEIFLSSGKVDDALRYVQRARHAITPRNIPQSFIVDKGWSFSFFGNSSLLTIFPDVAPTLCLWFPSISSVKYVASRISRMTDRNDWVILEAVDDNGLLWKTDIQKKVMKKWAEKIINAPFIHNA